MTGFAAIGEHTDITLRRAGNTAVTAEMHETMAEVGLALTGDEPLQLPLDLDGVVRINQTELIGNTYAVRAVSYTHLTLPTTSRV